MPNTNLSHIEFIKTAIRTQTIEEIAATLHLTPKQVHYYINYYHLEQYCVPPKTDKAWELIGKNKVQCAVCGRWFQTINGAHLSKHDLTIAQYKERFGLNKNQPLCSKKMSEHWRSKAIERGFGQDESIYPGKRIFRAGKVRPHTYKKSRQAIAERIEKDYQRKAGQAKKPREYLKHIDANFVREVRNKNKLSFPAIAKIVAEKTGYRLSVTTIARIYYGKRSGFLRPG